MRRADVNGATRRLASGVDEVWVMNPWMRRNDPAQFNGQDEPLANVRDCLVAMPGSAGDLAMRVAAARAAGAPSVVRVCPGPRGHGYPLESWAMSPIPELCEREDLALVVDFGERIDYPWSELVAFARSCSRLAIVALGAPLSGPTAARALDATPNLIFDTSGLEGAPIASLVASLAASHGAYRLVFGSGRSGVTPDDIAAVLGGEDSEMVLSATARRLDKGSWGNEFL